MNVDEAKEIVSELADDLESSEQAQAIRVVLATLTLCQEIERNNREEARRAHRRNPAHLSR